MIVGLASALGGVARYALVVAVGARRDDAGWPLGTLIVNLLGCLALGVTSTAPGLAGSPQLQLSLVAALGSFTTVSAFVLESWQRRATHRSWIAYGMVTVFGCLLMLQLGQGLA